MIQLKDVLAMPPEERDRIIHEKILSTFRKKDGKNLPESAPSTNATDDMAIHLFVCKHWDAQGLLGNYFHHLEEVLCLEGKDEPDEEPSLYSLMHYKVGMFSTAALYVALHYEQWCLTDHGKKLSKQIEERVRTRANGK